MPNRRPNALRRGRANNEFEPSCITRIGEASHILFVRQRVQVANQTLQAFLQHMRIYLRGRNVGMAKKGLHDAQIGAIVQKMAGKSMAQDMGTDLAGAQTRRAGKAFQFTRQMLAGQMPTVAEGWE